MNIFGRFFVIDKGEKIRRIQTNTSHSIERQGVVMEAGLKCENSSCAGELVIVPTTREQFVDYDRVICSDVVVRFVGGYARFVCGLCGKRGGIHIPNLSGLVNELAIAVALTARKLTYAEERVLITACNLVLKRGAHMPERQLRIRTIRTLTKGDDARRRECLAMLFALRIEHQLGRQRITVTYDGESNFWRVELREFIPYEFEG